jgi:2-haloacid dehalogenase
MDIRYLSAILFDADNTLFDFDRAQREALLDAVGVSITEQGAEDIIQKFKAINERAWKELEDGELGKEELKVERFHRLKSEVEMAPSAEDAAEAFLESLSRKAYLLPGALETVQELKAQGIKLGLATNGFSRVQRSRLSLSPITACFDGIFISEEMSAHKPDPGYFGLCLSGLGVPLGECIMVGDSPSTDIAGAKAVGMFAVWINRDGRPYPGALPQPDIEIPMLGELPRVLGIGI